VSEYLAAQIDLPKYKQFIVQVHTDQALQYADAKIAVILWESFNWQQGLCYAGFKEVLKRTGLHKVSVYRGLKRLLDRGHIGCVGECRELRHARFRLIVNNKESADNRPGELPVGYSELPVGNRLGELPVGYSELHVGYSELPVGYSELPVGYSDSPKITPNHIEPIDESPVGGESYLNPLPESLPESLHTQAGVCVRGQGKKGKPTPDTDHDDDLEYFRQLAGCSSPADSSKSSPDSGDDDAEIMKLFKGLADKDLPSRYRSPTNGGSPSPADSPTNGHGPNGHGPTSPATDDLDHIVTTVIAAFANHPKPVSEPHIIRREMAKVLEMTPFDVFMRALTYHQTRVWSRKWDDVSFIPTPENFLINRTWEKNTPRVVLDAAKADYQRRQAHQDDYQIESPANKLDDRELSQYKRELARFSGDDFVDDGSDRNDG
jgi:hypothetical protein